MRRTYGFSTTIRKPGRPTRPRLNVETLETREVPTATPYIAPTDPAVTTQSILTVGDSVGGYRMAGIPDGLGAFDNGDGSFTLLMNHELGNTAGVTRAHGAVGAFVSEWVIRKSDFAVLSGQDLMQTVYGWDTATQVTGPQATVAFNRFCSGDLPAISAYFFDPTPNAPSSGDEVGTTDRIYMHGEEGGATGIQLGSVVTGPFAHSTYVLGKFNLATNGSGINAVGAWENALANPFPQLKTVVISDSDGGTGVMNNTVSVYVGTKTNSGSPVDRAGLTNGATKFIAVNGFADGSGATNEEISNTTTRATNITSGTRFSLSATTATTYSRPEDGAWDPNNPNVYYFVTTDQLDAAGDGLNSQIGQTRLWRLTFDDITNPDAGGKIDLLINGQTVNGEKVDMFDNITVNSQTGHIILLEDVGNAAHNGKVWDFDPASGSLVMVAQHDPARFGDVGIPATAPFNQDEETSGVIDMSAILGSNTYLLVDQAHYLINAANPNGFSNPNELVEGGQLMLLKETPKASFLAVGAGDARATDAVLWTRARDITRATGVGLIAQVSTDPTFATGLATFAGTTDPAHDYTIHVNATGLQPGTRYYYRFVADDGTISPMGTFVTAPGSTANVPVSFGFTGDADGLMRPYDATNSPDFAKPTSAGGGTFDYFVWLGDTIYETVSGAGVNVSGVTNSLTPTITTAAAHRLSVGQGVTIAGVGGAGGVNGTWFVTDVPTPTTFKIALASLPGNYTSGGVANGSPNYSPVVDLANPKAADYWTKYKQQFLPVSTGAYDGLSGYFSSTGHYTLLDNHELGNQQYINGGAPATAPTNTTDPQYDVNTSSNPADYKHSTGGFKTLQQAYDDYQPVRVETVNAPNDPRSDGTQKMYFAQPWGNNSIFINVDDRTNRDIRLRNASGDDTGPRADNPLRTMLGATELAWLEQSLLDAQAAGETWKIVATSSPIDQIGPIGGSLPGVAVGSDGGKSWMGGYWAERNALLKFIADNHIDHVVFFATDDHQLRINELMYSPTGDTANQASYVPVPGAISIVAGPIGATGPDTVTNHTYANIKALADDVANKEGLAGINPIGLDPNFPGLKNVMRDIDGVFTADPTPEPVDFYSPDTFNYATLNVSADGSTLSVGIKGMNSYLTNTFPQPGPGSSVRDILSFQIGLETTSLSVAQTPVAFGGTTTLKATLTDSVTQAPLAGKPVTFTLGSLVLGTATTDVNGVATISNVSVAGYAAGTYAGAIKASFNGDVGALKTSTSANLVVGKAATSFVSLSSPTITLHHPSTTVTGKIVSATGPTPTGSVVVTVRSFGVTGSGAIQADGSFAVTLATGSLPAGSFALDYTYAETANFQAGAGQGTLTVTYGFKNNTNLDHPVNSGATLPIKLELIDEAGLNVGAPDVPVKALYLKDANGNQYAANSPGNSNPGGLFKYDPGTRQYHFNLKTTGLRAGTYTFYFQNGADPLLHSFSFEVR